jgi:hypothetical protein
MITKRLSIMLGVATVGAALLAPVLGAMAGGGGGTHGSFPTGPNQNANGGNSSSGSGGSSGGNGGHGVAGGHGLPPGSGSGSGGKPPNGGPGPGPPR